jgi:hypothetical protein
MTLTPYQAILLKDLLELAPMSSVLEESLFSEQCDLQYVENLVRIYSEVVGSLGSFTDEQYEMLTKKLAD